jgi:hypothetical protein
MAGHLHIALGQTTWKRSDLERGIEADLCFYFDYEKLATVQAAIDRNFNDLADYPNPVLAIEVDLSPSKIDRPSIYKALRIPEVWRFHGGAISIEQLGAAGKYAAAEKSMFLWVRRDEIERWVTGSERSKALSWTNKLRAWIDGELHPRANGGDK